MEDELTNKLEDHPLLDPDEMYAKLEEKLRAGGHAAALERIRAAYETAKAAHAGQKRAHDHYRR